MKIRKKMENSWKIVKIIENYFMIFYYFSEFSYLTNKTTKKTVVRPISQSLLCLLVSVITYLRETTKFENSRELIHILRLLLSGQADFN